MFETTTTSASSFADAHAAGGGSYAGPERRRAGRDPTPWMAGMLDEIDYGMLLVAPGARVTYLNHAAVQELDDRHPLQLQAGRLGAPGAKDLAALGDALAAAQRGLRRLVMLGEGAQRISVSVVPMPGRGNAEPLTLLVLGKRQVCEQLTVQSFARGAGLTQAETRVLELLCAGEPPTRIATLQKVAVCTVRTQIGSIRAKTGAESIRELVRQIAVLPPLRCTLHRGAALQG